MERLGGDTLQVRFESPETLRGEFEKNIANRGVFVATEEDFELRAAITVEIILDYDNPSAPVLTLDGEVVHVVPPEMAGSGATPGVAVQFEASASALRERFEPFLGEAAPAEVDGDPALPDRRAARRGHVRVPVLVTRGNSPSLEVTSRDLSSSGILLSMRGDSLGIGEIVRIGLQSTEGGAHVEITGKVVREVPNRNGEVVAMAVAFDRRQAAEPAIRDLIESLREAGHCSRLGGISGSIADLGMPSLLQMFGSSAPAGTLIVESGGEQGVVAFADQQLIAAEVGHATGHDALVTMLQWTTGTFEFTASVASELMSSSEGLPFTNAVLAAVCAIDEAERDANEATMEAFQPEPEIATEAFQPQTPPIDSTTVFEVDPVQEDRARATLDKTEDAILELVRAGMNAERLYEVIPEPREVVRASLEGLVELGVLRPRVD